MGDVRRLLAKLMPRSPSFGGGFGGIPDLTAQDIAAAVGMCPAGLGRELMCRLWWPDSAQGGARPLEAIMLASVMAEWLKRQRAVGLAKLAKLIAEGGDARVSLRAARSELTAAIANRWPKMTAGNAPAYRAICYAVLFEMSGPRQCPKCGGTGYVRGADKVQRPCQRCEKRGVVAYTDAERAASCLVTDGAYRSSWSGVYDYLYRHCVQEESESRAVLARRLGRAFEDDFA